MQLDQSLHIYTQFFLSITNLDLLLWHIKNSLSLHKNFSRILLTERRGVLGKTIAYAAEG